MCKRLALLELEGLDLFAHEIGSLESLDIFVKPEEL